jgi:hypothetical protein
MTVAALPATKDYIENGVTTAFAAPFRFKSATDLIVRRYYADGTNALLAYGVDYSATGGGSDAGGTVTVTAAAVAGTRLRIRRRTTRAQATQYPQGDRFPAAAHEDALDRAMLIDQEQDDDLGDLDACALKVAVGDAAAGSLELPSDRASRLLAFDETKRPIAGPSLAAIATLLAMAFNPALAQAAENIAYTEAGFGAVGRALSARLQEEASVAGFGAVLDGLADDTVAIQKALDSGADVVTIRGTPRITAKLVIPEGVTLLARGKAVVSCDFDTLTEAAEILEGGAIVGVKFVGANRTVLGNHIGFDQDYYYDPNLNGILLRKDARCERVKVTGAHLGYYAAEVTGIELDRCQSEATGWAAVNFYHVGEFKIAGGRYNRCGTFGGVTMPSCYDGSITGVKVYNRTSTGINPGGSAAVGYNVERLAVTGCTVEAGDGINFENGAIGCTVAGNTVRINSQFGVSTGVGIGFYSHGGGAVSNNVVTGNTVNSATGGDGIKFGCNVGGQFIDRINVSGNTVGGVKVAITIQGAIVPRDCKVSGNTCGSNTYGFHQLAECSRLEVSGNSFTTNSNITIGNFYGIYLQGVPRNSSYRNNTTCGWGVHYMQAAQWVSSEIVDPRCFANEGDAAAFQVFNNTSGSTNLPVFTTNRTQTN